MTNDEFIEFARQLDIEGFEILNKANKEYASEENKFDNFEGIADFMRRFNPRLAEMTAEDVGWIYRLKHIISQIKDVSLREDMRGREIDDLNYGRLIAGMRAERVAKDSEVRVTSGASQDSDAECMDNLTFPLPVRYCQRVTEFHFPHDWHSMLGSCYHCLGHNSSGIM